MTTLYCRPTRRVALSVEPRLASWDVAGSLGQVRLADFLDHAEAVAAPMIAAVDGLLTVELTVGLRRELALTGGGRDLDNYLFPLAQRLDSSRIAAMFGCKVHGPSFLAVGQAQPDHPTAPAQFSVQIAGSYIRKEWKATLRERLLQVQHAVLAAGAIDMTIGITTGPGHRRDRHRRCLTVTRFPTRDHFAACNGTAPVEVSSGEKKTCRLSLRGWTLDGRASG